MLRQLRTSSPDVSADLAALLDRSTRMAEGVDDAVAAILADVRARRDAAVAEYTRRFDKREPVGGSYELSRARWDAAAAQVAPALRDALGFAATRIRAFHDRHAPRPGRLPRRVGQQAQVHRPDRRGTDADQECFTGTSPHYASTHSIAAIVE